MSEAIDDIEELRAQLKDLDREVLSLIKKRMDIVQDIGRLKEEKDLPTRDSDQEKKVVGRAREVSEELGLDPDVSEDVMLRLIDASLKVQEQDRMSQRSRGSGKSVLIIGGAGTMGRWFTSFLNSQDYDVEIADPAGPVDGVSSHESWEELDLSYDVIIVTTPIRQTREVLMKLADRRPDGLVFDIASIKGPISDALKALVDAGVTATSIHPMFGPDKKLLSGQHVAFIDLGVQEAVERAKRLFGGTMARLVDMDLDTHDHVIAYVLGLSHAVNIAFFSALSDCGYDLDELQQMSSTTFADQVEVADQVARENPRLYYEIQAFNDFNEEALEKLESALSSIQRVVSGRKEEDFVSIMEEGRSFLSNGDGSFGL
jgi:chorismate mutase/prephenate dehydrogenase